MVGGSHHHHPDEVGAERQRQLPQDQNQMAPTTAAMCTIVNETVVTRK